MKQQITSDNIEHLLFSFRNMWHYGYSLEIGDSQNIHIWCMWNCRQFQAFATFNYCRKSGSTRNRPKLGFGVKHHWWIWWSLGKKWNCLKQQKKHTYKDNHTRIFITEGRWEVLIILAICQISYFCSLSERFKGANLRSLDVRTNQIWSCCQVLRFSNEWPKLLVLHYDYELVMFLSKIWIVTTLEILIMVITHKSWYGHPLNQPMVGISYHEKGDGNAEPLFTSGVCPSLTVAI